MRQPSSAVVINEQQIIKSKLPDEHVLYFAMSLGLLSIDKYNILNAIGACKQVGQLMKDLLIDDLTSITHPLQKLLRMRLIEIDDGC